MTMPDDPRPSPRPQDRDHSGHDLDVVAAFAGDPADVDREIAAALVASCAECRAEFELHRQIMSFLATAPAVSLADDERGRLHEAVEGVLARPTVVSMTERRRQPGQLLFRIGAAAAALVVVASLGGVFRNLGGEPVTQAFSTIANDLDGAESAAGAAPTTTAQGGDTLYMASEESARLVGGDSEAVKNEVDELVDEAANRVASGTAEDAPSDALTAAVPCQDQVADEEILDSAESVLDDEPIIIYVITGDDGADALVFRTGDCSAVDLG